MNKKITIISVCAVVLISVLGLGYFLTQSRSNSPQPKTQKASSTTYKIEKGLEDFAKPVKLAVEAFLDQNSSESPTSRTERLAQHFTAESGVYSYPTQNINPSITKSSATVLSITISSEQDDSSFSIDAFAKITFRKANGTSSVAYQKYWVPCKKASDGSIQIYDIGKY